MRGVILVDTSALVGYFRREDQHHEAAKSTLAVLRAERRKMVATTDIFNEVVTAVRRWMGYDKAIFVGETLRGSELLRQIPIDESLRQSAWRRFKELRLPMLSLTDCTSFEVMDKFGIQEAFTFDADFAKAGYKIIPASN